MTVIADSRWTVRTSISMASAVALLVGSLLSGAVAAGAPKPPPAPSGSLAALATDPSPWLHLEANSLQRSPIYLGSTPRELALGLTPVDGGVATLPTTARALGELQLKGIYQSLVAKKTITSKQTLTVESWPIRDDRGRLTWAYARWRASSTSPWRWLSTADIQNTDPNTFAPYTLDPAIPSQYDAIFGVPDDYGYDIVPAFGDSIWVRRSTDPALAAPIEAWLPNAQLVPYSAATRPVRPACARAAAAGAAQRQAHHLPPHGQGKHRDVPAGIVWVAAAPAPGPTPGSIVVDSYPADFATDFRDDVLALDGEDAAVFPISGRRERFTIKNNALADNQLAAVFDYLEERYQTLGLATRRQYFVWRGMPQTNLIAEIPGTNPTWLRC